MCCQTETEVAHQTFYLTLSQHTDTLPTSPSVDPITPGLPLLTTRPMRPFMRRTTNLVQQPGHSARGRAVHVQLCTQLVKVHPCLCNIQNHSMQWKPFTTITTHTETLIKLSYHNTDSRNSHQNGQQNLKA